MNVSDEKIQACAEIEEARGLRHKYESFNQRDQYWAMPSTHQIWADALPPKSEVGTFFSVLFQFVSPSFSIFSVSRSFFSCSFFPFPIFILF